MGDIDPRIGTEIGGYRVEALLASGRTGSVYRARDERLNRRVALRLLSPELGVDERFRERFLRESQVAASLDHPNIVPVYETGEVDGRLFVAMGYVDGAGLATLLEREGRLEPERTLLIVTQLAEALDAARWARGLVHGSLTPSDVLVAPDGAVGEHVYLRGFALRQELSPGATLAEASRHFGAVGYVAPEQIEGKPVSPRTDVYALGCVLFECLTGRPPFKDDSSDAVLKAHLYEQLPSVTRYSPGLPAGIDRVIRTSMAKWPGERYTTCGELAAAAQAALVRGAAQRERAPIDHPSPIAVTPLPEPAVQEGSANAPDSLAQTPKRRRTSIAAVGLVVLLALAAGAIWLTRSDGDSVSSAAPAPTSPETLPEPKVVEGAGTTEPPAETAPDWVHEAVNPTPVVAETPPEPASDGPPRTALSLLPGSLVRIDAASGKILAKVSIPFPKLVASDGRSVWVLSDEGAREQLVQVKAATNAVTRVFNADTDAGVVGAELTAQRPNQLAVAGRSAWLGVHWGQVYRFAAGASAGEPTGFNDSAGELAADIEKPVAAAGSLWVHNGRGGILRVDPVTERIQARINGAEWVVASGAGFVWGTRPMRDPDYFEFATGDDTLVRIDTETNKTVLVGALGFEWADFAVAAGAVWASSPEDGTIVRLDPLTGEETQRIPVGREPGALAAGAGALWAAISREGTVTRYDIATGRVETIEVGGTPNDLVYARGSLWVAVDELAASVNPLTKAQYISRASVICDAASTRLRTAEEELGNGPRGFEEAEAWNKAAARYSEEAIAELRALPPPKADRAEFIEYYSLLEQLTSVFRQTAEAAWKHDAPGEEALIRRRGGLAHVIDAFEPRLQGCPVSRQT